MPLSANYHINLQTYTNRDDWIRTSGPFVPNEVRYQAAPHPATKAENTVLGRSQVEQFSKKMAI